MPGQIDVPPATVLGELVRQQDLTYQEVAERFMEVASKVAPGATLTAKHVQRLASGEVANPMKVTRRVLTQMFGMSVDELLSAPNGNSSDGGPSSRHKGRGTEEELLVMAMDRSRQFALMTGQIGLGEDTMEQIYEDVRDLAAAYPRRPVPELLPRIVDSQDLLFGLLEQRRTPAHARDLYMLAGITTGMLAKVAHDRGDSHMAMTHARTAHLCGVQADHPGLRAWVRGMQSLIAYWAARPHDALRYARQGAEEGSPGTAAVWLPVSEARAWATLGNAEEAQSCVRRAAQAREAVIPDELDEIGGLCTFGEVRQTYYTADAYTWLPELSEAAEGYAVDAVTAYADETNPEWAFGDQAGAEADLAIIRVNKGELEGAIDAFRPVLDLPAEQRILGVTTSARRVHDALRRSPISAPATLEEIEYFVTGAQQIRELTR